MNNSNYPLGMRLGLAIPLSWNYIHTWTHLSLLSMDKPDFIYLDAPRGGDLEGKREAQIEKGMDKGCTHFFIGDADMMYPHSTLKDLVNLVEYKGADLGSVICYRGYEPYDPIIWEKGGHKLLKPFEDFQFGDIVEAGATGCSCLLVKRRVFEELPKPWFRVLEEEKTVDGKRMYYRSGEDFYFTSNAVKAGFKLKVITEYDIGHIREAVVTRHMYMIWNTVSGLTGEQMIQLFLKTRDPNWVVRELGEANKD
jgi:hypothetical protein